MRSARLAFVLLMAACNMGCGTLHLKPPPPPAQTMPDADAAEVPPANGGARVLVSTDVPARVVLASGGEVTRANGELVHVERGTVLCHTTPCSLGMPYGEYDVILEGLGDHHSRRSALTIRVAHATEVVNHTLGQRGVSIGKPLGAIFMLAGAASLGLALGLTEGNMRRADAGMQAFALGGTAAIAFGGVLYFVSPFVRQEGSTTQWNPPARWHTVGGGLGVRF